jgi:drug/metabolite transporter (DMT)-like permease
MKWALVAVISASSALADVLQSAGMKDHGEIQEFRPRAVAGHLARLIPNRNILAAVASLAVSFFAFLALISVSELSFAVPATAATYVLETILAKYLLREQVDWRRWAGATLVAGGVALLMLQGS